MESESPIKAWVRRYSPLKSRNKPLPPRPPPEEDHSPGKVRAPGRPISGNVSPTKLGAEGTNKTAKRKLSSLLKHKSSEPAAEAQALHRRAQSTPVPQDDRPQSAHSEKHDELTKKVSTLEAQLRAARAELATASTSTANAFRRTSPWRPRPPHARRANSFQLEAYTDREIAEHQQRLLQGSRFTGVVESLLEPDYKSASTTAAAYSTRGRGSTRSVSGSGHEQAMADYRNLEAGYMDDTEDDARRLARKRSELRAAEWMRVQEHMAKEKNNYTTGSKRIHEHGNATAEERPARRQKQSHVELQEKALPKFPRSRRTVSESASSSSVKLRNGRDTSPFLTGPHPQKSHVGASRPQQPGDSVKQGVVKGEADNDMLRHAKQPPAKEDENVTIFAGDEDDERGRPSPPRRKGMSPLRLPAVSEEFEWDEEVF